MSINLLSTTTSRPIHWIRQAAVRLNQAISWINYETSRTDVTANYTLADGDSYLAVMGGFTVALSGPETIRKIIIKDEAGSASTSPITVQGTIDGATNYTINTNYGSLRLISDGSNWFVI